MLAILNISQYDSAHVAEVECVGPKGTDVAGYCKTLTHVLGCILLTLELEDEQEDKCRHV